MTLSKSVFRVLAGFVFILFSIVRVPFPAPDIVANDCSGMLYVRLDIKTVNGLETENKLLMQPATEDFRMTSFSTFNIQGRSARDADPDALSSAKHDAFKHLLRASGTRSIRNRNLSREGALHDESILSYEGYIKTPYQISYQGIDAETGLYAVDMQLSFAPLAYPERWGFHYLKKKLYETIKNMVSVFL
ncbi:hypothetical protein JCM14469_04020 [Desulfatiferula olefinivorans]